MARPDGGPVTIGWREYVDLPRLGIRRIKAKIDTGARSSSLHCQEIRVEGDRVRLVIPHERAHDPHPIVVDHALAGTVVVRNSGGDEEERPYIDTPLVLGPFRRRVRLTLTDRTGMLFPLLIGRTALHGVVVDPTARYLTGTGRR